LAGGDPGGEMAKNAGGVLLPVSAEPGKGDGEAALFKGSAMTRRGAVAALSYMSCSVLLVMFNKAALSSYKFPCANVITLLQMVCSTCLLYVLRRLKIISFTNSEPSVPSDSLFFVPFRILLRTSPLSLSYLLYMLASMESVRGVNVPMYTTLRRTTVAFTMTMEYFLAKQKHTPPIIGSVALIVFGAFIAGARDLSFDARGYAIVFVANITTAVYLATINRIGKSSGLNSFGLMWCNGLVCGPAVLLLTYIQGDLKKTIEFPYLYSPGFQVVLLFSCTLAFLLNYTIFWNTILNSALTQSMCGNLKVWSPSNSSTRLNMRSILKSFMICYFCRISSLLDLAGYSSVGFLLICLMSSAKGLASLAQ
uniref:Sugar phosphate transporter domain-containing protein n=1 Tax=Aegilops tauschii subsp. strangulata TaxID=200361 RepID=A0A453P340_AEGTS